MIISPWQPNKISLPRYQKIAFLETDIGQTEFTPNGLLSLNIITDPLLGPSWSHLLTPEWYPTRIFEFFV